MFYFVGFSKSYSLGDTDDRNIEFQFIRNDSLVDRGLTVRILKMLLKSLKNK